MAIAIQFGDLLQVIYKMATQQAHQQMIVDT